MAKIDVLDILRAKRSTPLEFDFDNLWIPPINSYLTQQDIDGLRSIATSLKLSSKIKLKYQMIDDIMRRRGFKRFSAGTNRVVYSFSEDDRFLVKIAVDKVGMQDNPMEYKNQFLLKPYVTKMFYTSPCGTVGFVERVLPIKNKEEFKEIAPDVFEILVNKILGKYVVEDVGTKYFMNWGVRAFQSPVLLDYPYCYELDGNKLFCTKKNPVTGELCNGEIDYDNGFNHLVCTRCGKTYLATDLRDDSTDNKIIIIKGGNTQMKVMLKKGDQVFSNPIATDSYMVRPKKKQDSNPHGFKATIYNPNKVNESPSKIDIVNSVKEVEPKEILEEDKSKLNEYVDPTPIEIDEEVASEDVAEPIKQSVEEVSEDEVIQQDYDYEDNSPMIEPIRKPSNKQPRDSAGRFASPKNGGNGKSGRKKSNYIPTK